jgi:hypothetical protein
LAIFAAYETLFTLVCWSHYKAMCTNPGALPKGIVTPEEYAAYTAKYEQLPRDQRSSMPRMCKKCLNYKGPGVHHCSVCNRCTQDMDHHCPWVNNCVGKMNQKYFILFVLYVALGEFVSILMLVARGVKCLSKPGSCADPAPPFGVLICIVVLVLSIFFLVFVIAMMCDQYEAIMEGNSIDRLKGVAKKVRACSVLVGAGSHVRVRGALLTAPPPLSLSLSLSLSFFLFLSVPLAAARSKRAVKASGAYLARSRLGRGFCPSRAARLSHVGCGRRSERRRSRTFRSEGAAL